MQKFLGILTFFFTGLENKEKIVIILIPVRYVPSMHVSRAKALKAKIAGCVLLVEMFVDFTAKEFFDCNHNTRVLNTIIDYLFM